MRKKLTLVLVAAIVAVTFMGCREEQDALIFGSTTRMVNWFDSAWPGGNNASNMDVLRLVSDLGTVAFTREETWIINPTVVRYYTIITNPDGSRTYTYHIHEDLFFSDGRRITAADYVGGILLRNSPEWRELGAHVIADPLLVGHAAYSAVREPGDTAPRHFQGVRLYDEFSFSVTIAAENLPNFFEINSASVGPKPMHVWAPGVTVIDSPMGARLCDNLSVELLQRYVNDEATGQRFRPTVFSGAYVLADFNPRTHTAVLELNPYFKGLYDGHRPEIPRIIVMEVSQAALVDSFATGRVHVLAGIGGQNIDPLLDIVERPGSNKSSHYYPRAGFGKILFRCDHGPTASHAVRQAMAWISDRDEFARQFTFGYGVIGHGWYGQAMREYQVNREEFHRRMTAYHFNPARATELLVNDGWVFNAQGGPYAEGSGEPRFRRNADGQLESLTIEWFSTDDNRVSDLIAALIVPEAARVGIRINRHIGDFPTLQREMNNEITQFHMFNLAVSWASPAVFPWYAFSTNPEFHGTFNTSRITDQELYQLAVAMKETEPGDFENWDRRWLEFQLRFNYMLPMLPLYSDLFFDFYPANLENFYTSPFQQWPFAIQWARLR